jgi:hypothetical protein
MKRSNWLLLGFTAVSIVLLCVSVALAAAGGLPEFASIAMDTVAGLLLGTGIHGFRRERRKMNPSE